MDADSPVKKIKKKKKVCLWYWIYLERCVGFSFWFGGFGLHGHCKRPGYNILFSRQTNAMGTKNTQRKNQTEHPSKTVASLKHCTWQAFHQKTWTENKCAPTSQKYICHSKTPSELWKHENKSTRKQNGTGLAWKVCWHLRRYLRRRCDNAKGRTAEWE